MHSLSPIEPPTYRWLITAEEPAGSSGLTGIGRTADVHRGRSRRCPLATRQGSDQCKALLGHECNDTEWHFVINQVDAKADAPATIHVMWANGNSADVALAKITGGVAHYVTTDNLDTVVTSATATIYGGWSGQFNLSHGPCGATSTSSAPPSPTSPVPPS